MNDLDGHLSTYLNNHLKSTCIVNIVNMNKEKISNKYVLILGQSNYIINRNFSLTNYKNNLIKHNNYNESSLFVGRIFNFNIWNYAKSFKHLTLLFNDCKINFCGNFIQCSEFKQHSINGYVSFKWPLELRHMKSNNK